MNRISPVVKNLLIINVLLFVVSYFWNMRSQTGASITEYLALYYPASSHFHPYQFVTHMFMHGGWAHLLFNMYALWMFGTAVEDRWGGKRFLFYYLFTGLGAAALHTFVNFLIYGGMSSAINTFVAAPSPELFEAFVEKHAEYFNQKVYDFINAWSLAPDSTVYAQDALATMRNIYQSNINIPTVGASGAIFGLLLAFGMMYPEARLMIIFLPIAIKAKWFVLIYGGIELVLGMSQPGSSIAHFAHIGGMLFGFLLIRFWQLQARRRLRKNGFT